MGTLFRTAVCRSAVFFRNRTARTCAFVAHSSSPRAAQRQCRVVRSVAMPHRASICSCARLRFGELPYLPKDSHFTATRGPIPTYREDSHLLFDGTRRALALLLSSRVGAARPVVQPPAAVIGVGCEHARPSGTAGHSLRRSHAVTTTTAVGGGGCACVCVRGGGGAQECLEASRSFRGHVWKFRAASRSFRRGLRFREASIGDDGLHCSFTGIELRWWYHLPLGCSRAAPSGPALTRSALGFLFSNSQLAVVRRQCAPHAGRSRCTPGMQVQWGLGGHTIRPACPPELPVASTPY